MNERFDPSSATSYETAEDVITVESPDNFVDSENSEEKHEKPKSSERLERGEKFFRELSGLPESYHVSAEHKLLFSAISNDTDRSGFPVPPREIATFTALGLEYMGIRLPFTPEYQHLIHKAVLKEHLASSADSDSFYSDLERENSRWQDSLSRVLSEFFIPDARQEALERNKAYHQAEDDLKNEQLRKSIHKDEQDKLKIEQQLIDDGTLTQEEILEYNQFPTKSKEIFHEFRRLTTEEYERRCPKRKEEGLNVYRHRIKRYAELADEHLKRFLFSTGLEQSELMYKKLGLNSPHESLNSVQTRSPGMRTAIAMKLKKHRDFNAAKNEQTLLTYLGQHGVLKNSPELAELLEQASELYGRYYGGIALKYVDSENAYYHPNNEEIRKISHQRLEEHKNYIEIYHRIAQDKANEEIESFKKKCAKAFFPEQKSIEDIYFLPTGIVAKSKSGQFRTTLVSPLDQDITDLLSNQEAAAAWRKFWIEHQPVYDRVALDAVEQDIHSKISEAEDSTDRKIRRFSKINQISYPKPLDPETGLIYSDIQLDDIEFLQPIVDELGDFIKKVNLDVPSQEISLKSTRLEILDFLAGNSIGDQLSLCNSDCDVTINGVRELFSNAGPEKHDKAYSRLMSEIGISLYNQLTGKALSKYRSIAGDSVNVSQISFYKAYKKSIVDPRERRRIVERTVFLKDFIDYIKGEAAPAKAEFFDSLRKKPAIEG